MLRLFLSLKGTILTCGQFHQKYIAGCDYFLVKTDGGIKEVINVKKLSPTEK